MASNQTSNLGLSQWEADDEVLRADFNSDNAKIDAAVGALTQTVALKGNCTIVTGTYVGTGTYGKDDPNVLDFAPLKPLFLFVADDDAYGHHMIVCRGARSATSTSDGKYTSISTVTWTDTGVRWYSSDQYNASASYQMNSRGRTYHYIALC